MSGNDREREAALRLDRLFAPRTVAVVGASPGGTGPGNNFLRNLRAYGFRGAIYPIHPSADAVDGVPAYRTLADAPEPIDYAYVAIAAERVPALIAASNGRVRFAQVMSSGFGEHADGEALQAALMAAAQASGTRLLGPNCMGTHSPRGRLTFVEGPDVEPGCVGIVSQSGGLSIDMLRRGKIRGLQFSGLVTLGNSVDLGPCDLLEYFLADTQTRVIGFYLEDVSEGRHFFELLQRAEGTKPVVLLKGGRTAQGQRASASHTGALAGDDRIWSGLARQIGMAMVETLDEFLDALLAFQSLHPNRDHPTRRVVLFGNGGGASVLAADCFGLRGFDIAPFDAQTSAALSALHLPAGSSVANPVDTPANALRQEDGRVVGRILEVIYAHTPPDALVLHLNLPVLLNYKHADLLGNLIEETLRLQSRHPGKAHFVLVLRSDGEPEIEERKREYRQRAVKAGIPTFSEIADAAKALSAVRDYERFVLDLPDAGSSH